LLSIEEVERIAHLARLSLSDDEKARFARQLSAILDYAAELAEIDVDDVAPTATVLRVRSVTRDSDEVTASLARPDALANAPQSDGASFIVQATLNEA
jgi:aspartyl-tRNA(Asn)/glutamyl-tRNA(Gln) amidotransferase subunit C